MSKFPFLSQNRATAMQSLLLEWTNHPTNDHSILSQPRFLRFTYKARSNAFNFTRALITLNASLRLHKLPRVYAHRGFRKLHELKLGRNLIMSIYKPKQYSNIKHAI
jgi:hypothetical protein